MKNYAKVIGFILLLFFSYLPSHALAEDSFAPGPGWQAIPAYGPELAILADWQGTTSSNNTTDTNAEEENSEANVQTAYSENSETTNTAANPFGNLMGMGGLGGLLGGLTGGTGGMCNMLGGLTGGTGGIGNIFGGGLGGGGGNSISADELQKQIDTGTVSVNMFGQQYDDARDLPVGCKEMVISYATMGLNNNSLLGLDGPFFPTAAGGSGGGWSVTADFDPCKPGRETQWVSPIVIDTDHSGAIALDGGTIQFDIAPHIAGLETIPVPAPGKDMFLVWDKAGTETIEGAEREYKEGEIIDITELFGPEDYSRSDFSKLAYNDDGFTKLRKLCDVDNDGDVDKNDTALSAEVAAKLKLWSPLSGELVLFKDTDIVIDIRAGSYERHPSDVEGWAVEYKMNDAQGRLLGYQWLSSKTSTPLCVDVLLAVQGE